MLAAEGQLIPYPQEPMKLHLSFSDKKKFSLSEESVSYQNLPVANQEMRAFSINIATRHVQF